MKLLATLREALQGRYEIGQEAGRGGMAMVFAARDLKHDRKVAVKILRPELASMLGPERFLREIRIAARLQHPHILPLYDSGEANGLLYYIMPFVEGESLRERLSRERQLPLDDALRITRECGEALAYAHANDVVHRDIKPGNILLAEGSAVVADFGIAKAISAAGGDQLTGTGLSVGTPDYMSPEQAAGDALDGRSDVYSLGCVLYEMLSGSTPYQGPSAQVVLARHTLDPIPSLRAARPAVTPAIDVVIQQAMAKAPADRFAGMGDFLEALERAATGEASVPVAALAPRLRPGRRSLLWATAGAVLLAALGLAAGTGLLPNPFAGGAGPDDGQPRLAVLPFESIGRPEDQYVADGLTDEITTRVAGVSGLDVIARSSVLPYAGSAKPPREIARELRVGYLLTGSVRTDRRADGSGAVRVTPRLIRADDSEEIWSGRYDVDLVPGELLDVQSVIADGVAEALNVSLLLPERLAMAARPTDVPAAYEAYLRGNAYASRTYAEEPSRLAVQAYERAVTADPAFALAWARLSQAHSRYYYFDRAAERLVAAETTLARAVALDSTLAAVHLARGLIHYLGYFDYDRALPEFEYVRRARPNDSEVLSYLATIERRRGNIEESVTRLRRAQELDPRSQLYALELAASYLMLREFENAERMLDRAIELAPDWLAAHVTRSFLYWTWKGDLDRARQAMDRALETHSMREVLAYLVLYHQHYIMSLDGKFEDSLDVLGPEDLNADPGLVYLAKGFSLQPRDTARARAYFDSARTIWEPRVAARPDEWTARTRLGLTYAGLGRTDDALREGRQAVSLRPMTADAQAGAYARAYMVQIAIHVGELDTAFAYLQPLLAHPSPISPTLVRNDPLFAPLREHPGFRDLFRQ